MQIKRVGKAGPIVRGNTESELLAENRSMILYDSTESQGQEEVSVQ